MGQRYTSDKLYHFVGWHHPTNAKENYKILSKILKSDCVKPRNGDGITITIDWSKDWSKKIYEGELLDPTVTCYADIPFECLPIHTSKYGEFGLAFDRGDLAIRGARPVIYMPYHPSDNSHSTIHGRALINRIVDAAQIVAKKVEGEPKGVNSSYDKAIEELETVLVRDLVAFLKPFKFTDKDDDPANVYMEREWRMYGKLDFECEPELVREVIVASSYVKRAKADFPEYAHKVVACPRDHFGKWRSFGHIFWLRLTRTVYTNRYPPL